MSKDDRDTMGNTLVHKCLTILLLFITLTCGPKREIDSTPVDSAASAEQDQSANRVDTQNPDVPNNIIQYGGASDDDVRKALEKFALFSEVESASLQYFQISDSLKYIRSTNTLDEPADTLFVHALKDKAYKSILNYKQLISHDISGKEKFPSIMQLTRVTDAADSSSRYLPEIKPSEVLSTGNFLFLGGAPFISKLEPEDNNIFRDPQGKPELHFSANITENTSYVLNSIRHHFNSGIEIKYGPPLNTYDIGPRDVHGIGSLIHQFTQRIPVYFITESGLIDAYITSIKLKLAPEFLGCNSDLPDIHFACSKLIDPNDILGIFIPFDSSPLKSCSISRLSSYAWTADFNGDNIPDLACVSGTIEGISQDTLAELLWFVNVSGTWKIIDWGQTLDCT